LLFYKGVEPEETELEKKLSGLVDEYIGRLDDEKNSKETQKAAKSSSTQEGLAIRQKALEGEPRKANRQQQKQGESSDDESDEKQVEKKARAIAKSPAISFLELTNHRQDEKDELKRTLLQRQIEQEDLRRVAAERAHQERLTAEANERHLQREFQAQQLQLQRELHGELLQMQRASLQLQRETNQQSMEMVAQALAAVAKALESSNRN
jgi:hypothetical protein